MRDELGDVGAEGAAGDRPFRRKVFYIPGYDPFHPRRYRELYRREAAAQAAISGYEITLAARPGSGGNGWRVASVIEGVRTETDVEVLVWSDIVRDTMSQSITGTYLQLARTAWAYIGSGALWRLMRLRKGPVLAALYPVVALALQLGLAGLAGGGLGATLAGVLPGWGGDLAGIALGLAAVPLILRWFRRHDGRLFAWYLMHDFAHAARHGGALAPEIEDRLTRFRSAVTAALHGNADEVLVVGHSSGVHLAVSMLADMTRAGLPDRRPALSFLSLGQVVPMVSFLPRAHRLRADLHDLSMRDDLTWVDVTAPGDGCAFALCDPVSVSGVAPPGQRWPLVISAAFRQTLSPDRWKALRWRFFRLHFQYLCAFDRPGDYDYFRITAGPLTLGQRFASRAPSRSRIAAPVNRHTGMAA